MSGECDKCGEDQKKCLCNGADDHLVAQIVTECLHIMQYYPTITKMTACYNLTERILRLFAVQGSKECIKKLMDEFHEGINQCIEEYYE